MYHQSRSASGSRGRSYSYSGSRSRRPSQYGGRYSRGAGARTSTKWVLGKEISHFIQKAQPEVVEVAEQHLFSELKLSPTLANNIKGKGYEFMTPIQHETIPSLMEGRDLIGMANTGTGKTAAFLIPILQKISGDRTKKALIVAPTRELAFQIREECRDLSYNLGVFSTVVIGGAPMGRQIQDLRRNPQVVIATPGRLKDLIQRGIIYLEDFSTFVLDEVDMMVDIGFIRDIQYFVSLLPPVRQSIFFSATISPSLQGVVNSFVKNPVQVSVKKQDTAKSIDQDVVMVPDRNKKIEQLHEILTRKEAEKVLIFARTKRNVDKLSRELAARGFKVSAIHGNKTQGQRKRMLDLFKDGHAQILLATDVASRGLDIKNVTHVINYELPESYEDYVHRIGRTGRADKKGIALTFIEQ